MRLNFLFGAGLCLISASNVQAGFIENGDFSEGGSYWQTDTDGQGQSGDIVFNDAAILSIDHFSSPGDAGSSALNEAWFANTLFQQTWFQTHIYIYIVQQLWIKRHVRPKKLLWYPKNKSLNPLMFLFGTCLDQWLQTC